jgi:hypothetical protein
MKKIPSLPHMCPPRTIIEIARTVPVPKSLRTLQPYLVSGAVKGSNRMTKNVSPSDYLAAFRSAVAAGHRRSAASKVSVHASRLSNKIISTLPVANLCTSAVAAIQFMKLNLMASADCEPTSASRGFGIPVNPHGFAGESSYSGASHV